MILHQCQVEQTVNTLPGVRGRWGTRAPSTEERHLFVKELVVARITGPNGVVPLAMVRKRSAEQAGTRAAVLLVHGYGQNRYAWHLPSRSMSNYLAKEGFDVFNLDLRGHGRSRHLGAPRPEHVTEFVREDLPAAVEEVRRHNRDGRLFLIGHSLGGLVSYAAAPGLEGAVSGVVTLGSPYHFARGSLPLMLLGAMMLAVDRRVDLGRGAFPLKDAGELLRLARIFIESPLFPFPLRGFAPNSMEPAVLGQHMSLAMDQGSITVIRNLFLSTTDWRERGERLGGLSGYAGLFESMNLPLLVISGSKDDLAPPASVEPAFLRSRSADKTYKVFPRGHIDLLVGRDAPKTIWPLIMSWITRRSG